MTLVHNDFSVRNLCLRKDPGPNQSRVCIYDWEALRISHPQRDIGEFIAFVLPENSPVELWDRYIEMYRISFLQELINQDASAKTMETVQDSTRFKTVFHMCILELLWNRLGGYIHFSEYMPIPYVSRMVDNVLRYVKYFAKDFDFLATSSQ